MKNLKDENKINNNLLESIVVICIMSIYIVYGVSYLPLLIFLIPVPFVVLGIRNGIKSNIVSLVFTLLIVQILLSSSSGATLLLSFGPLSFMLNYCIKNRKSMRETIILSTLSFIIPFVLIILIEGQIANIDILKQAELQLNQFLEVQMEMLKEMGKSSYEILQTKYELQSIYDELLVLTPSLMGIFCVFVAYVNLSVSAFLIRKMGYGVVSKIGFSRFRLPNNIVSGIGIMLITGFIFRFLKVNYHQAFLFNISFLIGFIFLVQGLAVIDFFLKRKNINVVLRIVILAIVLMVIPIGSLLFFIGIFDSIFDIRKIRRKKS